MKNYDGGDDGRRYENPSKGSAKKASKYDAPTKTYTSFDDDAEMSAEYQDTIEAMIDAKLEFRDDISEEVADVIREEARHISAWAAYDKKGYDPEWIKQFIDDLKETDIDTVEDKLGEVFDAINKRNGQSMRSVLENLGYHKDDIAEFTDTLVDAAAKITSTGASHASSEGMSARSRREAIDFDDITVEAGEDSGDVNVVEPGAMDNVVALRAVVDNFDTVEQVIADNSGDDVTDAQRDGLNAFAGLMTPRINDLVNGLKKVNLAGPARKVFSWFKDKVQSGLKAPELDEAFTEPISDAGFHAAEAEINAALAEAAENVSLQPDGIIDRRPQYSAPKAAPEVNPDAGLVIDAKFTTPEVAPERVVDKEAVLNGREYGRIKQILLNVGKKTDTGRVFSVSDFDRGLDKMLDIPDDASENQLKIRDAARLFDENYEDEMQEFEEGINNFRDLMADADNIEVGSPETYDSTDVSTRINNAIDYIHDHKANLVKAGETAILDTLAGVDAKKYADLQNTVDDYNLRVGKVTKKEYNSALNRINEIDSALSDLQDVIDGKEFAYEPTRHAEKLARTKGDKFRAENANRYSELASSGDKAHFDEFYSAISHDRSESTYSPEQIAEKREIEDSRNRLNEVLSYVKDNYDSLLERGENEVLSVLNNMTADLYMDLQFDISEYEAGFGDISEEEYYDAKDRVAAVDSAVDYIIKNTDMVHGADISGRRGHGSRNADTGKAFDMFNPTIHSTNERARNIIDSDMIHGTLDMDAKIDAGKHAIKMAKVRQLADKIRSNRAELQNEGWKPGFISELEELTPESYQKLVDLVDSYEDKNNKAPGWFSRTFTRKGDVAYRIREQNKKKLERINDAISRFVKAE